MDNLLQDFLSTKSLEGCSDKTIGQYRFNIEKMIAAVGKDVTDITTPDIRRYLSNYRQQRNVGNVTLDNMRRNFTSFFGWLHKEGYINNNPAAAVRKIKTEKVIKSEFSEKEMEKLREGCKNIRERAILEILYATGMRIGELEKLNRDDINWIDNSVVVFGKGNKERKVYLNVRAELAVQKYLKQRTDKNEALFVSLRAPHNRIKISTYEKVMRDLGNRVGIHCHPHRFRRTCATTLLNKGMPVQEVSKILGHAKLETTLIYCTVDQENVAHSYNKIMN